MKKYAPLLIILAAILWSFDGLLRRELYSIPPATLVMLEHLVGVFIILPWIPGLLKKFKSLNKRDWLVLFLTSIVGSVFGTIFYTAALAKINYISYSVVVLLQQTQPIFAIALASLVLKEKLTKRYAVLAVIGLISAYFLAFPDFGPKFTNQAGEATAAFLAMGAAISWGSATVLGKLLLKSLNFAEAAVGRFILAIPMAFVASVILNQTFPVSQITSSQWLYLFGIALSSGMVAFLIYYKGLTNTQAKVSTFAEMTWPVSAAIIGYFILKERLTVTQTIAGTILLVDILILSLIINRDSKDPNEKIKKTNYSKR